MKDRKGKGRGGEEKKEKEKNEGKEKKKVLSHLSRLAPVGALLQHLFRLFTTLP